MIAKSLQTRIPCSIQQYNKTRPIVELVRLPAVETFAECLSIVNFRVCVLPFADLVCFSNKVNFLLKERAKRSDVCLFGRQSYRAANDRGHQCISLVSTKARCYYVWK